MDDIEDNNKKETSSFYDPYIDTVETVTTENTDSNDESVRYESLLNILKKNCEKDGTNKPFLISDDGVKIIL